MEKSIKKTYPPKILFPSLHLFLGVGFLVLTFYMIIKLFTIELSFNLIVQGLVVLSIVSFVSFHLIYGFLSNAKIVRFKENGFDLIEFNRLKKLKIDYNEIAGFSNSEVYFGTYAWKSKSLILYTNSNEAFEIINNYNSAITKFEIELKKRKIKFFGFEEYNTGLYFRKYKFVKQKSNAKM